MPPPSRLSAVKFGMVPAYQDCRGISAVKRGMSAVSYRSVFNTFFRTNQKFHVPCSIDGQGLLQRPRLRRFSVAVTRWS